MALTVLSPKYPAYTGNTQDDKYDIPHRPDIGNAWDYNTHDAELLQHQSVLINHAGRIIHLEGESVSGYSGYSGINGIIGHDGASGYSGYSGSGVSGYSGYSGSGVSGYSGYSGSGVSGYSGSGISGYSGYSGTGVSSSAFNTQSGSSYEIAASDAGKIITLSSGSATTVTIRTNTEVPIDIGTRIDLLQLGTGNVTFAGSGVTIYSKGGNKSVAAQYVGVTLIKNDTDIWVLIGDLIA